MQIIQGIAVSPGVAIGEALVMDNEGFRIPEHFVTRDAADAELDRLKNALAAAEAEISGNRDTITAELGEQYGAIFEAHLQMLRDVRLRSELEEGIISKHHSAEYSVSLVMRRYAKVFQSLSSSYLAERANDIFDIEKRLLRNLLGHRREGLSKLTSPVIVLAHNLTPSETANLDRRFVKGFVTEIGGPGSHTAIVAQGLEIPAVVGIGSFLTDVSGGDLVIIDGDHGRVILQPNVETIARYQLEEEENRSLEVKLESLKDLPAETTDHVQIRISGNIEFPTEAEQCIKRGAKGVGLYRTEFLYLAAETEPTEEVHYEAYAQVAKAMGENPVVIRTLDLGADKMAHLPRPEDEQNPFLGLRSIRLSLRNVPLFRIQLRAILRASVLGDIRVMFPMITTIMEYRQAKMVLADVMEDLIENNIPFNRDIKIGIMVEVPATVVMLDRFIDEIDFISIGTNDLIQYTLAVDRDNKEVANLYTAADPAVLKLIKLTLDTANKAGVPAGMCGQMSSNILYTMLLLGMGLREMSAPASAIPEIKKVCRSVSISHCEAVARHVMTLENARDIKNYLKDELKKVTPELMN